MTANMWVTGARPTVFQGLALIGVLLTGCSRGSVLDATWQWVGFTLPVERINVDTPERYTVRFGRDGRVAVRADCNRGSTGYSVSAERRMTLGPIVLTRMMCPPGSQDTRFLKEFGRARSYFLKDGDLFLELPVDSGTLRFRRQS